VNRFILTLLFIILGSIVAIADATENGFPGFFRDSLTAQKQAADVCVNFSITKTLSTLKAPMTTVGKFWNYADGRFIWEIGIPVASVLTYDGKNLKSWDVAENKWRGLDPSNRAIRMWLDFMSARNLTEEDLVKRFLFTVPIEKNEIPRVILQPRSKQERKYLKQIELKFDLAEKRLVQLLVIQGDGGTQLINFNSPKRMTAKELAMAPQAVVR
jgi:outer membrane lipoprotein-sorting protein